VSAAPAGGPVAVLGLGAMGAGLAGRVLATGRDLVAWNRSPGPVRALASRGARAAESCRAAAEAARVVLACVADDDASRAVWDGPDGALAGAGPGHLLIECSTLSPARAEALAAAARAAGAAFVEAPMLGSRPQVESGAVRFLLGGDEAAARAAAPLLASLGAGVVPTGAAGSAARAKLVVNALLGVEVAAFAEALALAAALGLDRDAAAALLADSSAASPVLKAVAAKVRGGPGRTDFALDLLRKDARYARAAAGPLALPLLRAAEEAFERAARGAPPGADIAAVAGPPGRR
jgi:3-hydroxyisobutyrate dehydrogenase-like beta-hydroxyacid dehydrogenase